MLIPNKKVRALGLIAIAAAGLATASCSKNEEPKKNYRSKEYQLNDKAVGGTASGKVIVQELSDTSFRLTVRLNRSGRDTTYTFALFKGNINAAVLDTAFALGSIKSQTSGAPIEAKMHISRIKISATETRRFNYDSLLNYEAFARITYYSSDPGISPHRLVAIGNVGKSAN